MCQKHDFLKKEVNFLKQQLFLKLFHGEFVSVCALYYNKRSLCRKRNFLVTARNNTVLGLLSNSFLSSASIFRKRLPQGSIVIKVYNPKLYCKLNYIRDVLGSWLFNKGCFMIAWQIP